MINTVRRLGPVLLLGAALSSCTAQYSQGPERFEPMDSFLDKASEETSTAHELLAQDSPFDESQEELENIEGTRLEKVIKADVVRLLVDHGFPKESVPKMVCTARFESNFSAFASNSNRNGTMDTGLFQINDIWLKACNVSREDLLDPEENTRCAYTVFKRQGIKAWVAYKRKRSICHKYKLEPSLSAMLQGMYQTPRRS